MNDHDPQWCEKCAGFTNQVIRDGMFTCENYQTHDDRSEFNRPVQWDGPGSPVVERREF